MTVGASSDGPTAMTRSTYSYGDHPSQLAELFLPAGSGPFPVTVVVHGGYWKAQYDRSLMEGLCSDLAAHGLAAWNIEYRRVGAGGGWPHTLDDVAAAVDLLVELNAPLDLSHVAAVGHSAGGHRDETGTSADSLTNAGSVNRAGSPSAPHVGGRRASNRPDVPAGTSA